MSRATLRAHSRCPETLMLMFDELLERHKQSPPAQLAISVVLERRREPAGAQRPIKQ
jgi:hypothetical protein